MKFIINIDKNFVIPDNRFNNYDYIDKLSLLRIKTCEYLNTFYLV